MTSPDPVELAQEALRYLADNDRPQGGQSRFNAEHLLQIANQLGGDQPTARPDREALDFLEVAARFVQRYLDTFGEVGDDATQANIDDWTDFVAKHRQQPNMGGDDLELKQLREWKASVLSKCKHSDGFDTLSWAGDKEGWGFVHYFIGHLETRALHAETVLAEAALAEPAREGTGIVNFIPMDIDTPPGTMVRFLGFNGTEWDQKHAREHLVVDQTYRVLRTEIGNWRTEVYFYEVPDQSFNSVMFQRDASQQGARRE